MKTISMTGLSIFLCAARVSALTLSWDIPPGDRLEITRTAKVKYLVNDRPRRLYDERNIIDLTCVERGAESSTVNGRFTVYELDPGDKVFRMREQFPSRFAIDRRGRYTVPKEYVMPNLRHLPAFPVKDVGRGDTWKENADLVLNNFSIPFKLTFPVEYRLEDIRKVDGVEIAIIHYGFVINVDIAGGYPDDFPITILGKDEGTIWWDTAGNRPRRMKEKYRIIFYFKSGKVDPDSNEFQMLIDTTMKIYKPVTPEEKEKEKRDLRKEMPDGVDVDTDRRGLVLRLGDILFDFDSAGLRNNSRDALESIASLLKKKYPDREIIVEGHTDSTGTDRYNRKLSYDRARTVAEYLRPRAGTDKLSYRGFGADKPIAGNDTRDGRQKNRRVEIIIKMQ